MIDPYDMLGLDKNADPDQIKAAFRKLAKQFHPDVGGATEKFKRILWAYEQLAGYGRASDKDCANRFDYEISLSVDRRPQVQDLFDDLKDGLRTLFDVDRPEFLNVFLELTPAEARTGGRIRLNVPMVRKCRHCYGFGQMFFANCKTCGGTGEEPYNKTTVLEIPKDVTDGWRAKQHLDNLFLTVIFKVEGSDSK